MATSLTVDFSQLRRSIDLKRQQLSDDAVKARLWEAATAYVEVLRSTIRSQVSTKASGNMEDALCTIVPPWKTPRGWAIGVGDIARVGLPSDPPVSRTTIREFWDWINDAIAEGEPSAVSAQRAALEAEAARLAARRERRRAAPPTPKPAPESAQPTMAQRQREIMREARKREAAEKEEVLARARRIGKKLDEIRRQKAGTTPQADATRMARTSLVQRALSIRRQIRALPGRDEASLLAKRTLRAKLAAVRRLLRALRETD